MNALQIIREACGIVGIPRPNSVSSSQDKGVVQLLGLLNSEGRQLSARFAWESLIREATFQTTAAEDQGALTTLIGAANAYRYILNDTLWNRDSAQPIIGPNSSLEWQLRKALDLSGPFTEYRIRGGHLLFNPTPTADEEIAFEYVTKNWCTSSDASEQRRAIEDDEDEVLLDDEIVLAGIEWRWRKAKGLQYAEDFNAYERMVADAMNRDATKRTLSLANKRSTRERSIAISPGNWPLT